LVFIAFLTLNFTYSSNNSEICSVDPTNCDFIVTKTICDGEGNVTVCFQSPSNSLCNDTWLIESDGVAKANGSTPKFCATVPINSVNGLLVSHYCNAVDVCQKKVFVECNPDCNALDFNFTLTDCKANFSINNPNGDELVWDFGDGSLAVSSNASTLMHEFPIIGGSFNVCVTGKIMVANNLTNNLDEPFTYFTCCFPVVVPSCVKCSSPSFTWSKAVPRFGENNLCRINLSFISPYESPSYTWNFGDGSPEETTTGRNNEHIFTGDGPFRICVKYTVLGKPYECCEWIIFPPCECCESADFIFSESENMDLIGCDKKGYHIEPICTTSGITEHFWEFSDGTVIKGLPPTYAPPDHVFTNFINSTGEICVTHIIKCNRMEIARLKKCRPYQKGVYVGHHGRTTRLSDFTPTGIKIKDFIDQNDNNSNIPLIIGGNLEIDIDANYIDGTWFAAGFYTQILVKNGKTFGLNGTKIFSAKRASPSRESCCRWSGIISENRTVLNWENIELKDAQFALYLPTLTFLDGAKLNFKGNKFTEVINGIISNSHKFNPVVFQNNLFSGCTDCTPLCGCGDGEGIKMNNIQLSGISFPFSTIKNEIRLFTEGIHAINTNLNAKSFHIHNITNNGVFFVKNSSISQNLTIDHLLVEHAKTAVKDEISGGGSHRLTAIASYPVPASSLKYFDVDKGYDISINKSTLNGNIKQNDIFTNGGTINFGIKCDLTSSSSNILNATWNKIHVNGGSEKTFGIALTSDVDAMQNGLVEHNLITNTVSNNGPGIFVNNWKTSKVLNNDIYLSSFKHGIEFSFAGGSIIKCNNIYNGSNGMNFSSSIENMILSNYCFGNKHSLNFNGNCKGTTGTKVAKNTFSNSSAECLFYSSNTAITGVQHHSDYNSWTFMNGQLDARHMGNPSSATQSEYFSPVGSPLPSIHRPLFTPITFFKAQGAIAGPQSNDCADICCPGSITIDPGTSGAEYDNWISQPNYLDGFTAAETISLHQSLMEVFLANPNWLINFQNISTFVTSHTNDFIGKSINIKNSLKFYNTQLQSQQVNLQGHYDQIELKQNMIDSIEAQIPLSADSISTQLLYEQINAIYNEIGMLYQSIDSVKLIYDQSNLIQLNEIELLITNLSSSTIVEQNEKQFNTILIKLLRNLALTQSDREILEAIAIQCPTIGGRIVTDANALCLSQFNSYFSHENCSQLQDNSAQNRSNFDSPYTVSINPNPVNDLISIDIKGLEDDNYRIAFFNEIGNRIQLESTFTSRSLIQYSTKFLQSGVYFVKVESGSHESTFRFMVIH